MSTNVRNFIMTVRRCVNMVPILLVRDNFCFPRPTQNTVNNFQYVSILYLQLFCVINFNRAVLLPPAFIDPNATVYHMESSRIGSGVHVEADVFLGPNSTIGFLSKFGSGAIVLGSVNIQPDVETNGNVLIEVNCTIGRDTKLYNSQLNVGVKIGAEVRLNRSRCGNNTRAGSLSVMVDSVLNEGVLLVGNVTLNKVFAGPYVQFYPDVTVTDIDLPKNTTVLKAPTTSWLLNMLSFFRKE